jgi:hypothetical protein
MPNEYLPPIARAEPECLSERDKHHVFAWFSLAFGIVGLLIFLTAPDTRGGVSAGIVTVLATYYFWQSKKG